jgi:DNA-binding transcriptional MerR regulator
MTGEQVARQTWKQWIAPEHYPKDADLLRREEVIARARALNVRRADGREVDERAMRYWENRGVIPHGTTPDRGYRYNLYPWWVVDLLYQACRYQAVGIELDQLPAIMREEAQRLARDRWARRKQPRQPTPPEDDFWWNVFDPELRERLREPTHPPFPRPRDEEYDRAVERLIGLLNTLAPNNGYASEALRHPARVRVSYIDEEGAAVREYEIALDDPGAADDYIAQDRESGEQARQLHAAEVIAEVRKSFYQTPDKE